MPGQCPRCRKAVYFAEEKLVLGKSYHKMCVKCGNCNKQVDSGSVTDHQDEIYCKSCYGRLFGPKGYGYGIGAGVLSMDDGTRYENGPPRSNVPSTLDAYIAPLKTDSTTTATSSTVVTKDTDNNIVKQTTVKQTSVYNSANNNSSNGRVLQQPGNRTPVGHPPKWGGGTYCARCSKSVFMAERIMAAGGAWHKACFTCQECNKRLDSNSIRERDSNIYCNPCYGKNFGPKGYWGWSAAKVS